MSKAAGGVLLCLAIVCFIMTAGFSYTSSPIVIIFPLAGAILLIISIILLAKKD